MIVMYHIRSPKNFFRF